MNVLKLECIILKFIQQITSQQENLEIQFPNRHASHGTFKEVHLEEDDEELKQEIENEYKNLLLDQFHPQESSHYSPSKGSMKKRTRSTVSKVTMSHPQLENNEPQYSEDTKELTTDSSSTVPPVKTVSFHRANQSQRFAATVRIIRISYELQKLNKYATKRDVYYTNTNLFSNRQQVVNEVIDDLSALLQTSRHKLHIVASARGLVYGQLTFQEFNGSVWNHVDCSQFRSIGGLTINPIEERVNDFKLLKGTSNLYNKMPPFLLIVEKDAVFERLIQDNFCETLPCVMLTSKGYPDVATRMFWVKLMRSIPDLYCFILTDADPHGVDIARVYKYGSQSMQFMNQELCLQEETELHLLERVHWIGLDIVDDFNSFSMSVKCQIPMSDHDNKKADTLLQEFARNGNSLPNNKNAVKQRDYDHWAKQLKYMKERGRKAEIQALSSKGLSFLANEYLPKKMIQLLI